MFHSCKESKSEMLKKSILGKWNVYASEMNNRPNGFMKDAYFEFRDDNSVFSNLFDDKNVHIYKINRDRLGIDTKEKFEMKISAINPDTLILEGKLKVFNMKFFLSRNK
ncbi:MAG: hypothetical protein IPO92_05550 [Saprospiraceae bacterium]|nr:hypothetical protein [Saprospiraceae bacterium]